ncbi:MAG: LapA family protein [Candidatus Rokubacteria bacterium]|nr:LapA family protein [Candidatus Rokubacteria bacterium]
MAVRYLIVALVASAITVFALQNTAPASVRFLLWSLELPLAGVILGSVAAGIVLVGLPLWIGRWQLGSRVRTLERRLAAADAERAEAGRADAERLRDSSSG